jgi:hypothetical protein
MKRLTTKKLNQVLALVLTIAALPATMAASQAGTIETLEQW